MKRQHWGSKFVYVVAAIGCAAGLGNLWRFPMLAYEYGGSAFIIALLVSNILLVYPLMMAETIVGQKMQAGPSLSMEKIRRGTGWIQWLGTLALIFVLMYYTPIMSWAVAYIPSALTGDFLTGAQTYFAEHVAHLTDNISILGDIQWGIAAALLAAYVVLFFVMRKGLKSVGRVLQFTVFAPFVLLILLSVRGLTLPGGMLGLESLFVPEWSALLDLQLRQAAIGQSFFSASLAFGYFIISGSFRNKKEEIPVSSIWVLLGNFIASLLSGVAVFSTLGFMAQEQGVPLAEAATGGPMLVFSVLPTAISYMPFLQQAIAVVLFLVVVALAFSSVIGIVEIIAGNFEDLVSQRRKKYVLPLVLGVAFLGGIPMTFGAGMYYIDILDHFVGGYLFMIVGMLEAFIFAYLIGAERLRTWINQTAESLRIGSWFRYVLYTIPFVLFAIILFVVYREFQSRYQDFPLFYIVFWGILPLVIVVFSSFVFNKFLKRKLAK